MGHPNTIIAESVLTEVLRIGKPPAVPGPSSTMQAVNGSPNGVLLGVAGDIAVQVDAPAIWQKTGSRTILTNTGWVLVGTGESADAANFPTYGLRLVGTAGATGRGTVNTSVLLFSTDPATGDFGVATDLWIEQINDAADGSSFRPTVQGMYEASLILPSASAAPGDSPVIGISVDASGAILTGPPFMFLQTSVQASAAEQDASLPSTLFCSAPIPIPQELIDQGLGVIRFHSSGEIIAPLVGMVLRRTAPCVIPT
jgi:hypothetical protein